MKRKREPYYAMHVKRKWERKRNATPRLRRRIKILIAAAVVLVLFVLFCLVGNLLKAYIDDYKAERAGESTNDAYVTAAPEPDRP